MKSEATDVVELVEVKSYEEQGMSWVFCFRILALRYQLKLWSYLKAQLEKICLQNHLVVGRIQFLVGDVTEGFRCLLPVGLGRPSVPCHMGLTMPHSVATCFIEASKREGLWERHT